MSTFSANEVQTELHSRLSSAADSTAQDARQRALAEANQFMLQNSVDPLGADAKAVSDQLARDGKLGSLIIDEFESIGNESQQGHTIDQLKQAEDGVAGESPTRRMFARTVVENASGIDGIIDGKDDNLITPEELKSFYNSGGFSGSGDAHVAGSTIAFSAPLSRDVPQPPPAVPSESASLPLEPYDPRYSTLPESPLPAETTAQIVPSSPDETVPPTIPDQVAPPDQTAPTETYEPVEPSAPQDLEASATEIPSDSLPPTQLTPHETPSAVEGDKPEQSSTDRKQRWGQREFQLNSDGSANYTVESGDCVWNVASDVMRHRLNREPSNAEILEMTNSISESSGLTRNGRHPDLIYPGEKLTIPPVESPNEPPESAQEKPGESDGQRQEPESINRVRGREMLGRLLGNEGALLKKVVTLSGVPDEQLASGIPKENLARVAADSNNGLQKDEREAIQYLVDNFSTISPDDNSLSPSDLKQFAENYLADDPNIDPSESVSSESQESTRRSTQDARQALGNLLDNDGELMKKVLTALEQKKTPEERLDTEQAIQAVGALYRDNGALAGKLAQIVPEASQRGLSRQELSTLSADTNNGLSDDERRVVTYFADHFPEVSPGDEYMTSQDIDRYLGEKMGVPKDGLETIVSDSSNGFSQEERDTLQFFLDNFPTISPDDQFITPMEIKAYVEQQAASSQPLRPSQGPLRR